MFSGGWLPLFRALAKNMADWKNPLREINLKWDLCMYFLCDRDIERFRFYNEEKTILTQNKTLTLIAAVGYDGREGPWL
jgi:hypothetical protein